MDGDHKIANSQLAFSSRIATSSFKDTMHARERPTKSVVDMLPGTALMAPSRFSNKCLESDYLADSRDRLFQLRESFKKDIFNLVWDDISSKLLS